VEEAVMKIEMIPTEYAIDQEFNEYSYRIKLLNFWDGDPVWVIYCLECREFVMTNIGGFDHYGVDTAKFKTSEEAMVFFKTRMEETL